MCEIGCVGVWSLKRVDQPYFFSVFTFISLDNGGWPWRHALIIDKINIRIGQDYNSSLLRICRSHKEILSAARSLSGFQWVTWKRDVVSPHILCFIALQRRHKMSPMASQITGVSIVCPTVCSGADQRNIKAPRHWPLCKRNPTVSGRFPSQMASNAEYVSIWWRHRGSATNIDNIYNTCRRVRNTNISITQTSNWSHTMGLKDRCLIVSGWWFTFNSLWPSDAIWWYRSGSTLARVMALLNDTKPLSETVLTYQWGPVTITRGNFTNDTSTTKSSLKITFIKKNRSNLPGLIIESHITRPVIACL